jgi:hypothetical protein
MVKALGLSDPESPRKIGPFQPPAAMTKSPTSCATFYDAAEALWHRGRKGKLDAAETERGHAESEYTRVGKRARAVLLLRSVMTRHREDTRLRDVEPYRAEVERLGRLMFGPSFEVEVDADLRMCGRTLAGRTVPSSRRAAAPKRSSASSRGWPVRHWWRTGIHRRRRLAKMGAVFGTVGGQVIVLTCSPRRHGSVAAHHIELSAHR